MSDVTFPYEIYLEIGKKRVFASAVDWPGWCRSGKDETSAVDALVEAGPRYAEIIGDSFSAPQSSADLVISGRLPGSSTTDFGAPDIEFPGDSDPLRPGEVDRWVGILKSCWRAFDTSVEKANGRELKKGPRGGGRDLQKMIDHVVESDAGYLRALGWKWSKSEGLSLQQRVENIRQEILNGLQAAADGIIEKEGPRGGKRWPLRYFVRRLAWHCVDHTWEIEDRIV